MQVRCRHCRRLLLCIWMLLCTMNSQSTCNFSFIVLSHRIVYAIAFKMALKIVQSKFPCMRLCWWIRVCVCACLLSHLAVLLICGVKIHWMHSLSATSISIDFSVVHVHAPSIDWTDIVENGKTMSGLLLFCKLIIWHLSCSNSNSNTKCANAYPLHVRFDCKLYGVKNDLIFTTMWYNQPLVLYRSFD